MDKVLVTNIQRFCLHDGPGIRTTLFLKGCSLRCPWCSNPENLESKIQTYTNKGKTGIFGKWFSCKELLRELLKDYIFYQDQNIISGCFIESCEQLDNIAGGVTFSGGEALLQMNRLIPLLQNLKNHKIHTAIETSLYAPNSDLVIALEYIDLFYVDIKLLDYRKVKEILQGNLKVFLENFRTVIEWNENGHFKPMVVRIPLIGGITDDEDNINIISKFLNNYKQHVLKIELIKEHTLGKSKYFSLGFSAPQYNGLNDNTLKDIKEKLLELDIPIEICKL